ncbi:MAG: hypothetical protein UT84_C0033G0003 [Candidatus Curtissbacteria bacterium GW2011_GWA1_40_16]|nr:MAG: hypothetical protein UT84_C0033G0003 [Candidatus Curtissbacteria bacterium GW2011_GWA1_40_16]
MTPPTVADFTRMPYEPSPLIWVNEDYTRAVVEPVDEVIEELAQSPSFVSYIKKADAYLVKNPTKGVGISAKYSKFLTK